MEKKSFAIIGGDLRSLKLIDLMEQDGNVVKVHGFDNYKNIANMEINNDLHKTIEGTDVVIGPLPCSNDNETINAPFCSNKILINDIFKIMGKNQLFVAGRISSKIAHLAEVYNVYTVDILDREEMAVLNAIPTAEGAIQIAMEEMQITLHDSNVLVMGFGRVGEVLAKMLNGIGANTFVEARKYADFAWIKSYGYKPVAINQLDEYISDMDVIFNTIPALILDEKLLGKVRKDCLIIDLASKPGGVDFDKAKMMDLKVNWALSLPGKVAPITAAKFIKDTIYNIIEELGV
ncbi:MAG TPA: dipicolinate synthase subunit DpsA [Clostridiales bacterium]|nr:dipicolinate synthase subunit DpsA [Clostridiales bacterium]